ncbi:chromosome segregation protein SMC, partial [Candidatus Woesearchaeota archaeon]|nr:chromosome segregation protein SMC [Candidatus Woesearchaeota archaeon]
MTKINKLVMQGFKSFANKTEIPLGNDFNCILGPNGSGKSNVLDALCFVLGKASSKSLRAEKSANLIYNGGKSKNPAKEAKVEIYFDNSNNIFPLTSKEVKVSRTVRSSGNSIYKIDDKTVTRNQIVELLNHGRINPDGYNIVLQGDIIRIVEMSPLERRKIIEEIAGISIYEEKKQKAINELNKVEDKLKESDIILAERQAYLRELKKERNQAMKFKELDDKIRRNKATVLHIRISDKDKKKSGLEQDICKRKEAITKIEDQIAEFRKEMEAQKKEIELINKEIEEKGDKDQVMIQKLIEELRVSIGTNRSRINSIENELARISERKVQLEQSFKDIDDKVTRLNNEKKTMEKQISDKQDQISLIEEKISKFKEKHKLSDSTDLEKEIESIDKEAEIKITEIQELREKQQELLREKDRLEYQVQTADEKITKVLEVQKEHQQEITRLKHTREEFKKATLELNQRLNEDSAVTAQLANARARLLKAKEELAKLNAKQASLSERFAGDIAIQRILELKSKVKGIYGTVSNLGEVSSEYTVALEVAAGSKVKSIVVDTDKTASECINYLKQNRLGTASFLPLNRMKASVPRPEVSHALNSPGVKGRAIDLIKFDPKFRNVFSYVFGNTVIVDNINVARNIGVGKLRMATLDGDLTELSGAMHGGFRKKLAGGFQEKELGSQIKELESQDADLESVVSNLEGKKQENEDSITRLRHLKAELEAEIIKSEKSLHLEDSDLDVSKNLKKDLAEKIESMDSELREITGKVTGANSELAQIKIRKQQIREKINALKNPTLLAELNTFDQKRSELKEDIIRIKTEMKNIDVQISTILEPELNNTKKILKQHNKEDEDFNTEIKDLKDLIKSQEKELKEKEGMQKEFYAKFKGLFKKREKINEEVAKIESKLYKNEDSRRNEELKLNTLNLDNAKVTAELEGLNMEYKEYEGVPIFKDKDEEKIKREIWEFEKMVRDIGAVNMRALEIYDKVQKEYENVLEKKEKLVSEREDVLVMMNEIETKKKDLFMNTYDAINENFQQKFLSLNTKGEATLDLEEPETVFEGGMNIKVRLVGKKFLDIRSLSGGEKTMTALAFLFAVQDHEPAPFYVLDEVDAALDKRNSEKLAELVRQYISKAQYIVISHNDGIISEADNLYGVSMNEHGISKVVSL